MVSELGVGDMALNSMHEFAESAGLKQTSGVLKSGRVCSSQLGPQAKLVYTRVV